MKKAYNPYSKLPFIELDDNEVRVIEKALKICDGGDKFAYKICEEDEFHEQRRDFRRAKMYLHFVLSRGNLHYYKERERARENWSKYMRSVRRSWRRKRKTIRGEGSRC
ncbi:hypothetical protein ES708_24235 [subsurface metagenome]